MTKKCKILTIVGARPQFIKASVVSREIRKYDEIEELLVHTGQHFDYQMSDIFFDELGIPAIKYNLGIDSLSHGAMTGRMLEAIEKVIIAENPHYVLVYGDTNSTLAGALAAKKLHKKLVHVEAGLRSFDMQMPEEINRILTDRISDLLFCPTETAVENLRKEGFENFSVCVENSGDVMFDAILYYLKQPEILRKVSDFNADLPENYILCTIHRSENTDNRARLVEIFEALEEVNREMPIILPVHPRTKKIIENYKIKTSIRLIEPVGYLEMLGLLKNCNLVVTDSGGLQKEAYFAEKFCVTIRDNTEWTELVENGFNKLAGCDKQKIIKYCKDFSVKEKDFSASLYGDGNAGKKIVASIFENFTKEFS